MPEFPDEKLQSDELGETIILTQHHNMREFLKEVELITGDERVFKKASEAPLAGNHVITEISLPYRIAWKCKTLTKVLFTPPCYGVMGGGVDIAHLSVKCLRDNFKGAHTYRIVKLPTQWRGRQ